MSEIRDQNHSDLAATSKDAMVPFLGDQEWSATAKLTSPNHANDTVSQHLPDAATLLTYQDVNTGHPDGTMDFSVGGDLNARNTQRGLEAHQPFTAEQTLAGLTGRLEAAFNAGQNRLVVMPMTETYSPNWPISSRTSGEASVHEALRSAFLNVEIIPGQQINQAELDRLPIKPATNANYFMVASWKNG